MGVDGVATVSDSTGNRIWSSALASPPLGKPYLEIGEGGMWVQDAGNPGSPVWGTTPPQGFFELHQTQNVGEVQTPTGPGGQPQDAGIGLMDLFCLAEEDGQMGLVPSQPGACVPLRYVTNLNGQASVQGTGWLQLADGNCLVPPQEGQADVGQSAVNVWPCSADNSNYWSFPGDGTIRAYQVWPVVDQNGNATINQCLTSSGSTQVCPAPGQPAQGAQWSNQWYDQSDQQNNQVFFTTMALNSSPS